MTDFRCNFKTRSGLSGDRRLSTLTTSLDDLIHKSLKDEQTECIRRIISLEEAVLPVLPTGFGKSVNTGGQCYVNSD